MFIFHVVILETERFYDIHMLQEKTLAQDVDKGSLNANGHGKSFYIPGI